MLVYHPGLKNFLAYASEDDTESYNGSILCLISDIVKHTWFHLIFIKVAKKTEPRLLYIAAKEEEGRLHKSFFSDFFASLPAVVHLFFLFFLFFFFLIILSLCSFLSLLQRA